MRLFLSSMVLSIFRAYLLEFLKVKGYYECLGFSQGQKILLQLAFAQSYDAQVYFLMNLREIWMLNFVINFMKP